MKKLLTFLLAFTLVFSISCNNKGTTGPGGGGSNPGDGGSTPGGGDKPDWFLTDEQQKVPQMIHNITLGQTVGQKQYYRIPAVVVTDKNTIVVAFDNRKTKNADIGFSGSDLIEPTVRRSEDGGKTWSEEIRVGKTPTSQVNSHGDPVLFKAKNGDLVMLAASGGAFAWQTERKSRITVSISKDDGKTWSEWVEVQGNIFEDGSKLYGKGYRKGFAASGRGTTLDDGTLVCTLLVTGEDGRTQKGAATYYSKDNGKTWQVGGVVQYPSNAYDEPKVIGQLVSGEHKGKLLMTARPNTQGQNRYWAVANSVDSDWVSFGDINLIDGRANAEGIRYTLKSEGHSKDRLLFLNCNSSTERVDLTLHMSEDEGKTWTIKKLVQGGRACYSSLDVLPDGTIITFAEENSTATERDNYDLVFRRFNLAWFTDGAQVYSDKW